METTLVYVAFVLVLTLSGHLVVSQEQPPEVTENDPPINAVDNSLTEEVPGGDQESSLAQSHVSSPSSRPDSISGIFNPRKCCWRSRPRARRLFVGNRCQSETVRRKIDFKLSKNDAVRQAVAKNAMNCEGRQEESKGLSDTCPSRFLRATHVFLYGKKCFIVRPHQQCVTYRSCQSVRSCAGRGGGGFFRDVEVVESSSSKNGKRSFLDDLVSRRDLSLADDSCARTPMSSSTCLPSGYRTFQVWIYCDFCGFRLINIQLPQCCSCKRYNKC